jgi:endonuclease/exonuclease/phosphatase family metal-dependent hydrolase
MPDTVRIMSFNLWHGGDAGGQPLEQSVAVIKAARADIVGLQETAGVAPEGQPRPDRAAEIAGRLGWSYVDQGDRTGVISRFKIVGATPRKWGVKLEMPSGRRVCLFNAHLAHAPYQPYQLLDIPYENAQFLKTAGEAVEAARAARGEQLERMLAEVAAAAAEGLPMFVTGDFNEPSHRDWSAAAAAAKQCPLRVEWPSTKAVEDAGFVDALRSVYPDPVKRPAYTWTPTTSITDPKDRHDRIDFVFAGGTGVHINAVEIIGESQEFADLVVEPYPSDHRSVVAEIEFPPHEKRPGHNE